MPTARIIISGKVQGVFFRASAKKIAAENNITGTIENKTDGTVEASACGSAENLEHFISWCKKGPAHATVSKVNVSFIPEKEYRDFSIT